MKTKSYANVDVYIKNNTTIALQFSGDGPDRWDFSAGPNTIPAFETGLAFSLQSPDGSLFQDHVVYCPASNPAELYDFTFQLQEANQPGAALGLLVGDTVPSGISCSISNICTGGINHQVIFEIAEST